MASFTSAEQTISSAGSITLAHGLGSTPKFVEWRLVCKTAELGYSVGDVVTGKNSSAGTQNVGMSLKVDGTNIKINFAAYTGGVSSPFQVINKTAGSFALNYITPGNWKVVLYAETAATSQFTSSDQTITDGGTLTLAHGLGATPKFVDFYLVCQTAEFGYSAGDIIVPRNTSAGTDNTGFTAKVDGTNVKVIFANRSGASAPVFWAVRNDGTGTDSLLTNANWKLRVYAVSTPLNTSFISSDQTITQGGTLTIAHGLGAAPAFAKHYLVCQTAELGFSAGNVIDPINTSYGTNNCGATVRWDSTNVYVYFANAGGGLNYIFRAIRDDGTGIGTLLTDGNWKLRLYVQLAA